MVKEAQAKGYDSDDNDYDDYWIGGQKGNGGQVAGLFASIRTAMVDLYMIGKK